MSLISVDSLRDIKSAKGDDDETRILVVGLVGGGKTTLLAKISKDEKKAHDMGNQKFKVRNLVAEGINMICWDVGGGAYVDAYWRDYHYERVDGVIFMVDARTSDSFEEAKKELFEILKSPKLDKLPLLVMANQSDAEEALSDVKVSEGMELHEISGREWKCAKVSANTEEGVQPALEWLIEKSGRP